MDLEEIALIQKVRTELNKLPEFNTYNMCDNHGKTRDHPNTVPMLKVDIRSACWDLQGEDWDQGIDEMMWEEFSFFCEMIEEDSGMEIFTDLNGYRVLLGSDIYAKIEEAQEKIEDMTNIELVDDEIYIEAMSEELKDILVGLLEEKEKLKKFLKLEDTLREWVRDYPKFKKEEEDEMEKAEEAIV